MFSSSLPTSTWACTSTCAWPHTHTHTHKTNGTQLHVHARTHARTHTHTHTQAKHSVSGKDMINISTFLPQVILLLCVCMQFSSNKTPAMVSDVALSRAMPTDMGSDHDQTWSLKCSPVPISLALELAPDEADEHWFQTWPGTGIKVLTCCRHWYRWLYAVDGMLKHTGAGLRWCRWTLVPNFTWHWDQSTHWYRWLLTDGSLKCKNFLTIKYSPVPITDTGDSMWFDGTLKSTNYLTAKYSPVPITDVGDSIWSDWMLKSTNYLTTKYSPVASTETGDTFNRWDVKIQELPDYEILTCPCHWYRGPHVVWRDVKIQELPDYDTLELAQDDADEH